MRSAQWSLLNSPFSLLLLFPCFLHYTEITLKSSFSLTPSFPLIHQLILLFKLQLCTFLLLPPLFPLFIRLTPLLPFLLREPLNWAPCSGFFPSQPIHHSKNKSDEVTSLLSVSHFLDPHWSTANSKVLNLICKNLPDYSL